MADRLTTHINRAGSLARKGNLIDLVGTITCNGTSSPTTIHMLGIASVTYGATGKWTVVLDDNYADIAVFPVLQKPTTETLDLRIDVGAVTAATGSVGNTFVLVFSLTSTGAPANPPDNTHKVHLLIKATKKSAFSVQG